MIKRTTEFKIRNWHNYNNARILLATSMRGVSKDLISRLICLTLLTDQYSIEYRTQTTLRPLSWNTTLKNLLAMSNRQEKISSWIQMRCAKLWLWYRATRTARYSSTHTSQPVSISYRRRNSKTLSRPRSTLSGDIRKTTPLLTRRSQNNQHSWILTRTTSPKTAPRILVVCHRPLNKLHHSIWNEMNPKNLLKLSPLKTHISRIKRWSKTTCTAWYSDLNRSH